MLVIFVYDVYRLVSVFQWMPMTTLFMEREKAGEGTNSCARTDARQRILKYPLHLYCPMFPPLESHSGHLRSPETHRTGQQHLLIMKILIKWVGEFKENFSGSKPTSTIYMKKECLFCHF